MRILVVDDEPLVLEDSVKTIKKACPGADIVTAGSYMEALEVAKSKIDVAFLDIEMPGKKGTELAAQLQQINGQINIIFLTAFPQYALEAYRLLASAYLLKPINLKEVQKVMAALRYEVKEQMTAHCFGIFSVYYNGQEVSFRREKEKELLAYLVARNGESASGDEICKALWPEDTIAKKDYFWKVLSDLRKDLEIIGASNVLVCGRNSYYLDKSLVTSDYFHYLDGLVDSWNEEFMSQYSGWAEEIKAKLYFDYMDGEE